MSETSPLSEQALVARDVLAEMLNQMTFPGAVEVAETPEQIELTVTSEEPMGLLIGKGGQTLNAIELIVATITQHKTQTYGKRLVVDAEGYRARQSERLQEIARTAAAQVLETSEAVSLEPMNARDRRTVHMALADMEGIETFSVGEDPYRHIVVGLPGQRPEGADRE